MSKYRIEPHQDSHGEQSAIMRDDQIVALLPFPIWNDAAKNIDEDDARDVAAMLDALQAQEEIEIPPMPATLDQFEGVIEVARQLAEAADIPAALREKCKKLCSDAEQTIKRERGFIQAAGRIRRAPGRPILGPAFTTTAEQPIQPGDDERRA